MDPGSRLEAYRRKRSADRTPEPAGTGDGEGSSGSPIFVVHEHAARTHHFDLRLEIDGVLVSWAVPKGPSTDPRERRLAVRTEDHPLAYAGFEGVIPAGAYGAGAVIVWDRGPYRNLRAEKEGDEPVGMAEALEEGKLELWLRGQKLRGGYALVRTGAAGGDRGDPGEEARWLLVKMDDEEADARRRPTTTEPESVLSGRTVSELAEGEPAE